MPPTPPSNDLDLMRQALRLAMLGRGTVEPNPMVACILVKDGQILAQAYHRRFGGLHAEAAALFAANNPPPAPPPTSPSNPAATARKKRPLASPS